MAALKFDAVETTLGAMFRDECVARDDLVDLGVADGLGHLTEQRIGDRGRRPHRKSAEHAARLTTVVIDLGEDRNTMTVHRVGDALVSGDHVAMEAVNEFLVGPVRGVRAVFLGDDEPGSTRGARGVVRGVLFGGFSVAGVVGEVRTEDDAITRAHGSELQGSPQVLVRHRPKRYARPRSLFMFWVGERTESVRSPTQNEG